MGERKKGVEQSAAEAEDKEGEEDEAARGTAISVCARATCVARSKGARQVYILPEAFGEFWRNDLDRIPVVYGPISLTATQSLAGWLVLSLHTRRSF